MRPLQTAWERAAAVSRLWSAALLTSVFDTTALEVSAESVGFRRHFTRDTRHMLPLADGASVLAGDTEAPSPTAPAVISCLLCGVLAPCLLLQIHPPWLHWTLACLHRFWHNDFLLHCCQQQWQKWAPAWHHGFYASCHSYRSVPRSLKAPSIDPLLLEPSPPWTLWISSSWIFF